FAGLVTVAERLWREVTHPPAPADGAAQKRPTISIGVALYPSRDVRTKDALLRGADTALRQAKRDGDNRICVFQQEGYLYTPVSEHLASLSSAPPGARSLSGKGSV